jgi:hypothetical protein
MATLLNLVSRGDLFRLDPNLEPHVLDFRCIYTSPRLKKWIEDDLPMLESTWNIEQSPLEQLQSFVEEIFCSAEPLTYEWQFKPLTHIKDGIWELKTADLRIFGWFQKKDHFVGVSADMKDRIKQHGLYIPYARDAANFRDKLDLDEPKFIPGDNPHDVVSNFGFP